MYIFIICNYNYCSPYILKIEWLEECMKQQAPAPEDNFLFVGKDSTYQAPPEPPSPLSKKVSFNKILSKLILIIFIIFVIIISTQVSFRLL
jgi:hypothetical protein